MFKLFIVIIISISLHAEKWADVIHPADPTSKGTIDAVSYA